MNSENPTPNAEHPAIGDQVFFRLDRGPNTGDWRPALIVRTWGAGAGAINLLVFTDCINDDLEKVWWATSRSEGLENGNWSHYPPSSIRPALTTTAVDPIETPTVPTQATDTAARAGSAAGADTTIEPQPAAATLAAAEAPNPTSAPPDASVGTTAAALPARSVEPTGVSTAPVGPATVSMTATSAIVSANDPPTQPPALPVNPAPPSVGVDGNRPVASNPNEPPAPPSVGVDGNRPNTPSEQPQTPEPAQPPQPGDPNWRGQP